MCSTSINISRSPSRQQGQTGAGQKTLTDPPPGYVRIQVEAMRRCHSDSATVEGYCRSSGPEFGHEARVGGSSDGARGVEGWKDGSTRRVGFLAATAGIALY